MLRKYSTHKIPEKFLRYYICGLSTETVVYKVRAFSSTVTFSGQ